MSNREPFITSNGDEVMPPDQDGEIEIELDINGRYISLYFKKLDIEGMLKLFDKSSGGRK